MKKVIYSAAIAICILLINLINCKANNLQIGIPTVNVGASTISFTIQWDNSWLVTTGPNNWDGAWIFIKRQACSDNVWNHALVSTVSGNHAITGGILQVDAVTDGMGVFIRRAAAGTGNIASCTATLQLQTAPNLVDNFKVFGIEMVNVPQGDFYIGDGTRGANNWGLTDVNPYPAKLITNAIQTAGIGAVGNYQTSGLGSTGALPAAFPLGWNKFYCMKYEISQEQYASFLNTLTYDQQVGPTRAAPNSVVGTSAIAGATPSRNGIKIKTAGTLNNIPAVYGCDLNGNGTYDEAADGLTIACNWINWASLLTYLDWCALRPMTEFEFEKSCRGTAAVSSVENAWGNATLLQAESGALTNSGLVSEVSTAAGIGLCAYGIGNTAKGPLRCGFAATATTLRIQAGASFYGIMDLSGNVAEQCVGGYLFDYSAFTAANGDGSLTSAGVFNTAGWPTLGGGQAGGIERGGDWYYGSIYLNVSDRSYGLTDNSNRVRQYWTGGRGIRNW